MESNERGPVAVVKVGGSLLDLADLSTRLRKWLAERQASQVIVVPGGGPLADVIRRYDALHALGEERSHWLALSAMALNAHLLVSLLPRAVVVPHPQACTVEWLQGKIPILDALAFAHADEGQPGCLPHCWSVTGDSLAARVARVAGAAELILLKSISLPAGIDWAEARRRGLVDAYFAEVVGDSLSVRFINFRH